MLPTPIQNQANTGNSTTGATTNGRQQSGTGFTNIDRILGANQGAGQKIGQALGNSLTGQANDVKAGIQASQNQFNTDLNTSKSSADNTIQAGQNYVRQPGESDDDFYSRLNNTDTDYTKVGTDLNNVAYNGPTALSNVDQLNSQAANVSALGRLAGTSAGQSQLLRSQVAQGGNYSQGQNALDSLLLGQGGQQYVQQGRTAANQVSQAATDASSNAANQALAAQQAIANNKTQTLQNLQSSLTGDGTVDASANPLGITGIETDATKAATDYTNNAQRLQQLISGYDANGNTIKASDLTDSDRQLLQNMGNYGVQNANLYVDPNSTQWQTALGQLAGRFTTTGLGSQLYTDQQKNAALNLSKILGDTQDADQINNATFNKQILADNGDEQNIFNNLTSGINSQISQNQNVISQLENLVQNHGGVNNLAQLFKGNGDTKDQASNDALFGMQGAYKQATGRDLRSDIDASSNKDLTGFFLNAQNPYNQTIQNLRNQISQNTESVQDAVLKRILGQA